MVFFLHYYFVCVHDFFALLRLSEREKKVGRTKGRTHSLRASLRFPYVSSKMYGNLRDYP